MRSTTLVLLSLLTLPRPALAQGAEPPTPDLRVEFVDEQGAPIAGATLIRGEKDDVDAARLFTQPDATADDHGVIDQTVPGEARYLLVGAKGRACRWLYPRRDKLSRVCDLGRVVLPKGITITGLIRDEAGKPIAGARLQARDVLAANHVKLRAAHQIATHFATFATSDERGIFRLRGVLPIGATVVVRAVGYHIGRVNFVNAFQPVVMQLQKGGYVAGKVVDPTGKPVECMINVAYEMGDNETIGEHRTKKDGTFRIALDYPGRYRVGAYPLHRGVARQWQYGEVVSGPAEGITITRTDAGASAKTVTVAVTDKTTGEKITKCRGVAVWVANQTFRFNSTFLETMLRSVGRTAAKPGRLTLPGPTTGQPETGRILVRAEGYAPVEIKDVTWDDEEVHEFKVDMVRESIVSGVVVDTETGEPVAGARVAVTTRKEKPGAAGGFFALTTQSIQRHSAGGPRTDEKGRFRVGQLAAGDYEIRITHGKRPDAKRVKFTLKPQEHRKAIEIEMRSGVTWAGKLTGVAIGKGWRIRVRKKARSSGVVFLGQSGPFAGTAGTGDPGVDAEGRFTVRNLHNALYQVELLVPDTGLPGEMLAIDLRSVRVRNDDFEKELNIFAKMPGTITGRVRWASAALPPGRLLIIAEGKPKNQMVMFTELPGFGVTLGQKVLARPDGSFTLRVPSGRYRIVAIDLATGVRVFRSDDWQRVSPEEVIESNPKISVALVRLTLKPDQGAPLIASRLQFRIDEPDEKNPLFAQVRSRQFDHGDGLLLRPGQTELELFLPTEEVTVLVRSSAHNLSDGQHQLNTPPVGELAFTPELGKVSKVEVPVEAPEPAKGIR